ncbi:DnaJ domain-containing protein [Thelonectria olida]|uniref:DnaJ domain-containing protein n=1 Tax=Thelonectria olida TaxID=1576542 RepID=A0A9P8W711_9HYPO|nr:DnaJ domain-containing protein [Thelonectria olida]
MTATLPPDPYKILGVTQDAQIPEIRSAHRKLVLKCHPDKVQDPTLKAQKQDEFQKVQQAYELLSNDKDRQRYDDQVRLAELRRQMQAKANSSAPRSTQTYKFEIRTPEPRPSSYKSSSGTPPSAKFTPMSRSYEESRERVFEIPVRREKSYESKSKREDRDRERERERAAEKERDRERRRKAEKAEEYARRAEEEARKARKAEKKAREKARDKDRQRDGEEKKRHAKTPYIEEELLFDEPIRVEKEKKKSSKKHDEKRDRSAHREEVPMSSIPPPPMPVLAKDEVQTRNAAAYIQSKNPAYSRGQFTHPPAAPTPPMPAGQSSPFAAPAEDDDVRRSSAKSRRGSAHKKPSREVLEDPEVINVSPSAHKASKAATAQATMSGSPPRYGRQNTMPADVYSRMPPMPSRAATFSGAYPSEPRGRERSRLQAQVSMESDSDGEYERRHSSRKHRSSKKHRSPDEYNRKTYKVETGRAILQDDYSRSFDPVQSGFSYYPNPNVRVDVGRQPRESSHRSSANDYADVPYKVKTSPDYGVHDVNYSSHYPTTPTYDDYYTSAFA